jgi:SAM-dependent methyltransferase
MVHNGSEFYDNKTVFEEYMRRRSRQENPNDSIEKPIIMDMIGSMDGLSVLDLGCGDAKFGLDLMQLGCLSYVGLEASENMVNGASRNLLGTEGKVYRTNIEDWEYPADTFDLVVSRLVLHYIDDVSKTVKQVHKTLKQSGKLVFSVEHPVITSSYKSYSNTKARHDWIVDDYFNTGIRHQNWLGGEVKKYHRTVEDYFITLQQAGFIVEQLRESRPIREHFVNEDNYNRRMRIPLFLFLAARKV